MLVKNGNMVIVEWGKAEAWSIFGVLPYEANIPGGTFLRATPGSPINVPDFSPHITGGNLVVPGNLDKVWVEALLPGGRREPVLGYKETVWGRVYFVGLSLSQMLSSSAIAIYGLQKATVGDTEIRAILSSLLSLGSPHKEIAPRPFPVKEASWGHSSLEFTCQTLQEATLLLPLTYSPRWKACLDGIPAKTYNIEHLLALKIPPGKHHLKLEYRMTRVGKTGIVISAASMVAFLFATYWGPFSACRNTHATPAGSAASGPGQNRRLF